MLKKGVIETIKVYEESTVNVPFCGKAIPVKMLDTKKVVVEYEVLEPIFMGRGIREGA